MHPSETHALPEALEALAPITLAEMDAIKLMNRLDTKYVTDEATLLRILEKAAAAGYRVLLTEGGRLNAYDSVYFDTAGLRMYYDHRNKHLVRQKVRTRSYVSSGDSFLEIKRKNNHGRTKKKRIAIPVQELQDFSGNARACAFLADHSWFTVQELTPSAETAFSRITLVNPAKTERITLDTGLHFKNYRTGRESSLCNGVVIELKQDGRAASQMRNILLEERVKPLRVSKYCIAVTLTDPTVRSGRFRQKVRILEKTIGNKLAAV